MHTSAVVNLTGVPETMLWTLHNRANEAERPDTILHDPDAVRIYRSIRYDFERSFGKPDGIHALRSRIFDDAVLPWISKHPFGTVVELACGLETQYQRCDNGNIKWLCVDVPEAIEVRERFLPSSERCKYVKNSVLDFSWMDQVVPENGVFVTAQGLFMYFEEKDVRQLIIAIVERFPECEIMFDTIPRWFSKRTQKGFSKTRNYQVPPMPWGINPSEIDKTLKSFSSKIVSVEHIPYGYLRGGKSLMHPFFSKIPLLRSLFPSIVHLQT